MKNYVPLILAVVLGLAAVVAVGRVLSSRKQATEASTSVVAAARDISRGEELTADMLRKKSVPLSSRPVQAVAWSEESRLEGQKAMRDIAEDDYVFLSDVVQSRSMASIVGEGEWAVTLSVGEGGIGSIVQPGDEVAVLGTFTMEKQEASADQSAPPEQISKEVTTVLFPRVRVLDVGLSQAGPGEEGGEDVIVGLPPQEAQVLVAAQEKARITLALRRPGDDSALNRLDLGVVDEDTFAKLLEGIESIKMSARPGIIAEGGTPADKQPAKK